MLEEQQHGMYQEPKRMIHELHHPHKYIQCTYRNDDIDIALVTKDFFNLSGKSFTHGETSIVNRNAINDAILTSKVDIFENARSVQSSRHQLTTRKLFTSDNNSFA